MAQRLSDLLQTREGEVMLTAICAESGETREEALNSAIRLYHDLLVGAMSGNQDLKALRAAKAASDASRAEVLVLMGHA